MSATKAITIILAITTLLLSCWSAAAAELEIVDVSPSVVMLVNEHGSNISCVALPEGLVFVDAGMSTEVAAEFRRRMERRFERQASALVLTHAHLDHIFGMAAFADLEVLAAESARPLFEHQLALDFSDEKLLAAYAGVFPTIAEDLEAAEPRLPGAWFSEEIVLGEGERRLEIHHSGGHSPGSCWIYLPAEQVVVAGDLMQSYKHPYFGDPGTDLGAWIGALAAWQDLGVEAVCPGHGAPVDAAYVGRVADYFVALTGTVAKLKTKGMSLEEVVTSSELPVGYWPENDPVPRWWPSCIARAFVLAEE